MWFISVTHAGRHPRYACRLENDVLFITLFLTLMAPLVETMCRISISSSCLDHEKSVLNEEEDFKTMNRLESWLS